MATGSADFSLIFDHELAAFLAFKEAGFHLVPIVLPVTPHYPPLPPSRNRTAANANWIGVSRIRCSGFPVKKPVRFNGGTVEPPPSSS